MNGTTQLTTSFKDLLDVHGVQGYHAALTALFSVSVGLLYALYSVHQIRKPIPGIPYNPEAISYILGDIPKFLSAPNPWTWWASQGARHKSPLVQVFMRPLGRPWVFVSDPWLATEISLRRTREFDRSHETASIFQGVMPGHHITLKSGDPQFKKNKELVRELMTPSFLHEVTAPRIYNAFVMLLDLWKRKIDLSKGRPFDAGNDVHNAALDIILAASFGFEDENSQLAKQIRCLEAAKTSQKNINGKLSNDVEFEFEAVPLEKDLGAFTVLIDSIGIALESPFPGIHHYLYRNLSPKMRQAAASRDKIRKREVSKSIERRSAGRPQKCGLDQLLAREDAIAAKDGRRPDYHSQTIMSELMGYLIGGHETTSSALRWSLKFLTENQHAQKSLRNALHEFYQEAKEQHRLPALEEILKANIAYVDAVVEECLRCAMVLPLIMREALVDTELLGARIPKGTSVMFFGNGPGVVMPALPVDDEKLSGIEKGYRQKIGSFDDANIQAFLPERWLKTITNEKGEEEAVFDANAGPARAFGHGPRACFGKRMALIEMKVFLTLVMWSYELLSVAPELSGHDESRALTRFPKNVFLKLREVR